MKENKFKIGQKVMITSPAKEEDRFKVGTVVGYHCISNNYYVQFNNEEAPHGWHASRLELLPEILQDKTLEELERTVKTARKAVDAIISIAKAFKEQVEAMECRVTIQQEADKDKQIAELKQEVEDLKKELAERPIVVMPKGAVVNIRLDKPMPEYEALKP